MVTGFGGSALVTPTPTSTKALEPEDSSEPVN
jgi:hypothetical protein